MRRIVTASVLLLLAAFLVDPAWAGDPDPAQRLRDAKRKEAELLGKLQVAHVWANVNHRRALQLLRLAEDLQKQLAKARTAVDPAVGALKQQVERLQAQVTSLQAELDEEQNRHVANVMALNQELASAASGLEDARLRQVQAENAADVARSELRLQKQELERVQWVHSRQAPRDSVARVLASIPAAHWRAELASGDALRARVALQVLGVLPDASNDGVDAILKAVGRDRSLLDAATRPLVRIGAPAVQPLVAAGCGEDSERSLDRGWVMHVLGQMGAEAKEALPWLDELAAGDGREATQAQHARNRIRKR